MTATVKEFQPRKVSRQEQLSEHFHNVNRILPEDQAVLTISPETPAKKALALMKEHGYSQLPVKEGDSILGLFTYRSFALEVAQGGEANCDISSLPVEEFLEHEVAYARLSDEFSNLINILDKKDSVVVSGPENLIAILTPLDVLRYLYSVANAFVLVEEIEVTLRALLRVATPDSEIFRTCITKALTKKYREKLPAQLEDMTFDDYIALIRHGDNWKHFQPVFGGTRDRARGKLDPIRIVRNDLFHFRRELKVEDHEQLAACRNWLLRCIRKVQARRGDSL